MEQIIKREQVKKEDTWAIEDIYASNELWEKEYKELEQLCDEIKNWKGKILPPRKTLTKPLLASCIDCSFLKEAPV